MVERTVLALTGADRLDFLQGLVTNDVTAGTIVYTALLTPQGKYIADFFVITDEEQILLDVKTSHAPTLFQRLSMYRLRADVQIAETALIVSRGTGTPPHDALMDPRHKALGWRLYGDTDVSDETDWDAVRVDNLVPEAGIELTPDSYILETNFEALNGVDFRKGCFVGQEIVARMKHKTELRKGLCRVAIEGDAAVGDAVTSDEKAIGTLHTIAGDKGLAYLRFDRAKGSMQAGNATLTRID